MLGLVPFIHQRQKKKQEVSPSLWLSCIQYTPAYRCFDLVFNKKSIESRFDKLRFIQWQNTDLRRRRTSI